MKRVNLASLVGVALLAMVVTQSASGAELARFDRARAERLDYTGFRLSSQQTLAIDASAFAYRSSGKRVMLTNAWILNAETREVVWELFEERDEWRNRYITDEKYEVTLPAGDYEVYYSTFPQTEERGWNFGGFDWKGNWFDRGINGIYDRLLDEEDVDDISDLYRRFSFTVSGSGDATGRDAVDRRYEEISKSAIVSINKVGNHEFIQQGFELTRPMKIRVYCNGEARDDGAYDYGWVMKADTREKVWQFKYRDSYEGGGAEKNRLVDATFEAPAGKYVAVYVTDDSHCWDRWNQAPPRDPAFWGLTLRAENPDDAKYAQLFDYEAAEMKNVVVELTRVGDDEYLKSGFTLKKPMKLRVYAIGEGVDRDMADYGWIVNAATRERVWEMDYDETDHAGGARKNRVSDEVVSFDKGSYLVYYVTDDSHAYPHWNSDPPMDREHYGITVTGVEGFNKSDVAEYKESEDENIIVSIIEVRDSEYIHKDFAIDKETLVHVFALGEGVDGRMYDYGWIEEAGTGRVVWEMTYRKTRHAGGARKNRMYSDTIRLEPGSYRVYYETDDSHAFNDWNQSPPYEPGSWGISLSKVSKQ